MTLASTRQDPAASSAPPARTRAAGPLCTVPRMGSTAAPAGAKPRPARRRLATDLAGRLRYGRPAFIVPGAQKCGTTAVAVYLARHPRIKVATTKEPDFFSRDARYYGLGAEGYRRLFPRGRRRSLKGQLFFEASVSYLTSPVAPER